MDEEEIIAATESIPGTSGETILDQEVPSGSEARQTGTITVERYIYIFNFIFICIKLY